MVVLSRIRRAIIEWCAHAEDFHPARAPSCTTRREDCPAQLHTRNHIQRWCRSYSCGRLLGTNQTQQAGMIVAVNHATGERRQDQRFEVLRRPIWLVERLLRPGLLDFVSINAFVAPAEQTSPQRLGLQAS